MSLITLLVVVLILGLVIYLVDIIPLPPPFKTVALVIVVLIAIVYLAGLIGVGPGVRLR